MRASSILAQTILGSGGVTPPPATTIGTIANSNGFAPQGNWRADYGYVLGPSGGVASIVDLSGNNRNFAEAVDTQQPLWVASDSGCNNQASIAGDGVDDRLTCSWAHAAITPATASTHIWFCMIAKQDTWTANDTLVSDGGVTIYQNTTSGGMRQYAGSGNGNQNNNLSGYKRIVSNFTGSASSYLWIGASVINGVAVGVGAVATNLVLLAAPGGVRFFNGRIAEFAWGFGDISPGAISAIDTYCSARYGASVLT